jgi:hypothetical protein
MAEWLKATDVGHNSLAYDDMPVLDRGTYRSHPIESSNLSVVVI